MRQRLFDFDVARLCLLVASIFAMPVIHAHGIAGNRYFPGTLTFDDPAVADELILPNFSATKYPVSSGDVVTDTTVDASFARLLTPDLAFGADSSWTQWKRKSLRSESGFGVTSINLKGRFYENDPHEALVSASLGWGLPGSGSSAIDAAVSSSIQPGVFVGKGFGDLPDRLAWLRPFGVVAGLSANLLTHRHSLGTVVEPATEMLGTAVTHNPNMLHYAFALEFSTLYLPDRFDGGPPKAEPLNQLVPSGGIRLRHTIGLRIRATDRGHDESRTILCRHHLPGRARSGGASEPRRRGPYRRKISTAFLPR